MNSHILTELIQFNHLKLKFPDLLPTHKCLLGICIAASVKDPLEVFEEPTKKVTPIALTNPEPRSSSVLCFDIRAPVSRPRGISFANKWECHRLHSMEEANAIIEDCLKRDGVMGYTHSFDRISNP